MGDGYAAALVGWLARRRVPLGFAAGAVTLVLARPTWRSWVAGLVVASAGEFVRIWAAGHLEKGREVTRSGPYRWTGHPLYVGSSVMALGIVIAANDLVVAIVAVVYMGATIMAAVHSEERYLRRAFPSAYDEYRRSEGGEMERAFSWERVMRNREYRAVVGLVTGFAFLALKVGLQI